ncbi:sensor histidine kinase [Kineosporia rhizophila]|uniref:sensor histidine kinase n=1 Tax=Kineosporia rhizophila TaxID=84633 RepID=UPI001E371319|nr:sensor histidine kinase [Kineosporia rhizophila]MCE0537030.1 sensor histidine kinase [Kineosporia rhizophila]
MKGGIQQFTQLARETDEDPDYARPTPTPRQQRWDVVTGLLLAAGTLTSTLLYRSFVGRDNDVLQISILESVLWSLAVALPLCVRRRHPVPVLLVVSAMFIGMQSRAVIEGTMSSIALFSALYTTGAWTQDRRVANIVRLLVVVIMFCWLAYLISATAWAETGPDAEPDEGPIPAHLASVIYSTLINILFFAGAWYFGNAAWNRAAQEEQLRRRTLELARERDESARRAVLAERVRIARELHDVVAHHVSLMGVQAGAARRVLDRDPELTRQTLGVIEESGRSAVEEMRRLLVVLRDSDDQKDGDETTASPPSSGVDALEQLLRNAATPGLATEFTVVGTPATLTAAVSVSVFRIAQEAVTNALKHAGASRIDCRLRYLAEAVEVEVVDNGRGQAPLGGKGSGLGQVGMRERVEMHGGTLEIGRRPEGGYRVRARIPLVRAAVTGNTENERTAVPR